MKGSLDASEGTYREEKRLNLFSFLSFLLSLIPFVDIFLSTFVVKTQS